MAVTLADVKMYLRIDSTYEDSLLESFMGAADSYLAASIDGYTDKLSDADFAAKADMVKLALVSEMYRNRDPSNDQRDTFPYYITSQIAQLQYWADIEPASTPDDGGEDAGDEPNNEPAGGDDAGDEPNTEPAGGDDTQPGEGEP